MFLRKKVTEYRWRNWSGRLSAVPARYELPASEEALATLLRETSGLVRVAGAGHSFTPIAVSEALLISLDRLSGVIDHDADAMRATVWGGTKIHALGSALHTRGLALLNQGDIDRQSVSGAVSTGTHGTGATLGSLSSAVAGARLVLADGSTLDCDTARNPDVLDAVRVSLGALGIITRLTLQCRAPYGLRERGQVMAVEDIFRNLDRLRDGARHFEFWWFPYADAAICKFLEEGEAPRPRRSAEEMSRGGTMDEEQRLFQQLNELTRAVPVLAAPINRAITAAAAKGMTKAGNENRSLRLSYEAFPSPRLVRFNEMEFAVSARNGADCAREIVAMVRKRRIATAFPIEFRYVKADMGWLSPFYERDSVTISVHQYAKMDPKPLFGPCEDIFRTYEGRPHWGKMHSHGPADFARLYPKWNEFLALRERLDPNGRFLNSYLGGVLARA
ncbi:MAG: D-arabinono-1,4-lactone oxidase [Alphaproteobacteria bacterium]